MKDLMDYSIDKNLSPRDSLQSFARRNGPFPPNQGSNPVANENEHYSYSSAPPTPATPQVYLSSLFKHII